MEFFGGHNIYETIIQILSDGKFIINNIIIPEVKVLNYWSYKGDAHQNDFVFECESVENCYKYLITTNRGHLDVLNILPNDRLIAIVIHRKTRNDLSSKFYVYIGEKYIYTSYQIYGLDWEGINNCISVYVNTDTNNIRSILVSEHFNPEDVQIFEPLLYLHKSPGGLQF